MSSFADSEKRRLLALARQSLKLAVQGLPPLAEFPPDAFFRVPGGAFVTLRMRRRLRGCIGRLPSDVAPVSLAEAVAGCARSAALEDPRFSPVTSDELPQIEIELSILSAPFDIAPAEIIVGRHGLYVSRRWSRGVLLPQVATEFRWTPGRFLEETCAKAGLSRDAWKEADTRVQAFTAEIFSEAEFPAENSAEPGTGPGLGDTHSIST